MNESIKVIGNIPMSLLTAADKTLSNTLTKAANEQLPMQTFKRTQHVALKSTPRVEHKIDSPAGI
jgi:hypothetical protein